MFFHFDYKPYVAIIGDMKDSKKISDRNLIQIRLQEILHEVNQEYSQDISANFMITLGDEFQGLLSCGENTMDIISKIERKMYPINIRFGIGVGEITTDINRNMAIGADGPGYYRARAAIQYLKKNEKRKEINAANIRIEADERNRASVILLNTILSLLTTIKESWSERQREVIGNMIVYQDGQANVAKRMNITQPTVQRILAKGKYYVYKEAVETIGEALEEITQEDV